MAFQLLYICDPYVAQNYILGHPRIFAALEKNESEVVKQVIERLEMESHVPAKYR